MITNFCKKWQQFGQKAPIWWRKYFINHNFTSLLFTGIRTSQRQRDARQQKTEFVNPLVNYKSNIMEVKPYNSDVHSSGLASQSWSSKPYAYVQYVQTLLLKIKNNFAGKKLVKILAFFSL
jgi:hypothetical protein